MDSKLFETRQILLFIVNSPDYCEFEVQQQLQELVFLGTINIHGNTIQTSEFYTKEITTTNNSPILEIVRDEVKMRCRILNIRMLDFFLIDLTDAPMYKAMWYGDQ